LRCVVESTAHRDVVSRSFARAVESNQVASSRRVRDAIAPRRARIRARQIYLHPIAREINPERRFRELGRDFFGG